MICEQQAGTDTHSLHEGHIAVTPIRFVLSLSERTTFAHSFAVQGCV